MPVKTEKPYNETLNYQALEVIRPLPKHAFAVSVVLPFIGVAILVIGSQLIDQANHVGATVYHAIAGVLILAGFFGWSRRIKLFRQQEATQFTQFAHDNHLIYDDKPGYEPNGTLFTLGHSQFTGARLKGAINDYPYALYWHRYTTGYGRSQITAYYDVVEITLPKVVPQIYIDHRDFEHVAADPIGQVFGRANLHQLEGPFSKTFKVYFNENYASEALTLLNPLFMQHLLDHKLKNDIEFAGNKLFIYSQESFASDKQKFQTLLGTTEFLIGELERQFDTFTFEPRDGDVGSMYIKSIKQDVADVSGGW